MNCRKLVIGLLFSLTFIALKAQDIAERTGDGKPTDSNIVYVGRWDTANPLLYYSYWGGAYLRVDFTGTSIAIWLQSGTALVVSIDGESPRAVQGKAGITTLNITNLAEGRHTLLVGAAGQNYELVFQGLVLAPGGVTYAPEEKIWIEYIGDSITTGCGPDGISTVNYAWNSAEALGCDHSQIAFSGLALTSGYGCLEHKVGLDSLYFCLKNYNHIQEKPIIKWDFKKRPDMIVINLGTNDKCGNASEATFKRSITSFLSRLRTHYPGKPIVVLRPLNGSYEGPIRSAVKQMNDAGDGWVYYIDTTNWLQPSKFGWHASQFRGWHKNGCKFTAGSENNYRRNDK